MKQDMGPISVKSPTWEKKEKNIVLKSEKSSAGTVSFIKTI